MPKRQPWRQTPPETEYEQHARIVKDAPVSHAHSSVPSRTPASLGKPSPSRWRPGGAGALFTSVAWAGSVRSRVPDHGGPATHRAIPRQNRQSSPATQNMPLSTSTGRATPRATPTGTVHQGIRASIPRGSPDGLRTATRAAAASGKATAHRRRRTRRSQLKSTGRPGPHRPVGMPPDDAPFGVALSQQLSMQSAGAKAMWFIARIIAIGGPVHAPGWVLIPLP